MSLGDINPFKNSPARFSNTSPFSPLRKNSSSRTSSGSSNPFVKMRMKWRKVAETFERKIAEIVERFVSWSRIMAFEGVRIKSFPPKASHVQACFRKSHCELEITIPLRLVVILARKRITIRNRARKIWGSEGRGVPFPSLGRTRVIRAKVMLLLFGAPLSRHSRRSDARWA